MACLSHTVSCFDPGNHDLYQVTQTGFIWVIENLESHGIQEYHFPGLKSHEVNYWPWKVMENNS